MLRRPRSWKNFVPDGEKNEPGHCHDRAVVILHKMTITRRKFAELGVGAAFSLGSKMIYGQGVSTHSAKALPRAAPSGRPFNAHFVDVAHQAGLRDPIIYG